MTQDTDFIQRYLAQIRAYLWNFQVSISSTARYETLCENYPGTVAPLSASTILLILRQTGQDHLKRIDLSFTVMFDNNVRLSFYQKISIMPGHPIR